VRWPGDYRKSNHHSAVLPASEEAVEPRFAAMAERDHDNNETLARARLIELLEDIDAWRFTDAAFNQGRIALRVVLGKTPSDCEMIDYFVKCLRAGFPILRTLMGEPPGSRGIAWVMNNPDGNHTYIKLKVEDDGISEVAWVISCHMSKHQ
jgi:hypothetical protein